MRIDKFETREEDGKLYVTVTAPAEWYGHVPKFEIRTPQIIKLLKEKGMEHGVCLVEAKIENQREHTRQGTWIFEKKVLDKSPEPVILKEEKQVQPKPTRKRRTRSSTKKVSTEE